MRYGLIGRRLGHSFSPEIHACIGDYRYELLELEPEQTADFFRRRDFCGVNVTIPYKEQIIPYLDGLSPAAARIGAVNTVINREGKLWGYNTDYAGAMDWIRRRQVDWRGKKVLLLGSGGAAKTMRAVAEDLGAGSIVTVSRSGRPGTVSYDQAQASHSDARGLINATPAGMFPDSEGQPMDIAGLPRLTAVFDAIYNPLNTNLILAAKERGLTAEGGLYMLAAQAVYASRLFLGFDSDPPEGQTEEIYRRLRRDKENLVLIGMPASGKSLVGKLLAEKTGRRFLDADDWVAQRQGESPAQIIRSRGEAAFRRIEKEAIAQLAEENGCVIATGGGAVLDGDNMRHLRRNGRLYFLDRPLALLQPYDDRPLSADRQALERLYRQRYPLYCQAAHVRIDAGGPAEAVCEKILEEFDKCVSW
ncbi:MAG: shikimate dehydrogenase [Firmicutes bacterium]|nr:shikimate dehydrogenase [Bacillota bacterium]